MSNTRTYMKTDFCLTLCTVGLLLLQIATAFAQDPRVLQAPKVLADPYGKKAVLGYLLRLPILLDLASAELGLSEGQTDTLAEIVKSEEEELDKLYRQSSRYDAVSYQDRYREILRTTDSKLKKLFNPFQYARFRDWILKQWALEKGEVAPSLDEIAKLGVHT